MPCLFMQPLFNFAAAPPALASPRSLSPSFDLNSSVYTSAALAAQIQQVRDRSPRSMPLLLLMRLFRSFQQLITPPSPPALQLQQQLGMPSSTAASLHLAPQFAPFAPAQQLLVASLPASASAAASSTAPLLQSPLYQRVQLPQHPQPHNDTGTGFEANADAQVCVQCGCVQAAAQTAVTARRRSFLTR